MELATCDEVAVGDTHSFDTAGLHLVPDTSGVADALVRLCVSRGLTPPTVGTEIASDATHVMLLNALSPITPSHDAAAIVRSTFERLRALGGTHRARALGLIVAQNLGGDFGLRSNPGERAELGAVAGLAKSAAREWPRVNVRVLDLAPGLSADEMSAQLLRELTTTAGELETGLVGSTRVTPRLVATGSRVEPTHPPKPGDVWIVSGGARGVTADCLQALARRTPLRLVLLGRTPIDNPEPLAAKTARTDAELKRALLDEARAGGLKLTPVELQRQVSGILASREARATCDALRALGAEVRYVAVDIADSSAIAHVVQEVRSKWGPIRGLVHAAGVLADKALHEKTDAQFSLVYGTKVGGFRALLAATKDEPLSAIGCFSSVAARAGNAGQSDYAAANEALNKLCQVEQHRRGSDCIVRSINWGPWDGGMVGAGLKTHFAAMGVSLIPLRAGAEIFADLITGALPTSVECVVGAGEFSGPEPDARQVQR